MRRRSHLSIKHCFALVATMLAFSSAMPANAAAVRFLDSNGTLTSARNVDVDGILYDVEILDGSCNGLFMGCDAALFEFQTAEAAEAASQALMEQVLLDTSDGFFDSIPNLTHGCEASSDDCLIFTLFGRASFNTQIALGAGAVNYSVETRDFVFSGGGLDAAVPTDAAASVAIAKWSRSATNMIPESSTIALTALGVALLLIFAGARRTAIHPAVLTIGALYLPEDHKRE